MTKSFVYRSQHSDVLHTLLNIKVTKLYVTDYSILFFEEVHITPKVWLCGRLTLDLKNWIFDTPSRCKTRPLNPMAVLRGGFAYVALGEASFAIWVADSTFLKREREREIRAPRRRQFAMVSSFLFAATRRLLRVGRGRLLPSHA